MLFAKSRQPQRISLGNMIIMNWQHCFVCLIFVHGLHTQSITDSDGDGHMNLRAENKKSQKKIKSNTCFRTNISQKSDTERLKSFRAQIAKDMPAYNSSLALKQQITDIGYTIVNNIDQIKQQYDQDGTVNHDLAATTYTLLLDVNGKVREYGVMETGNLITSLALVLPSYDAVRILHRLEK